VSMRIRSTSALFSAIACATLACERDAPEAPAIGGKTPPIAARATRSGDPDLEKLRAHIDHGRLEQARGLQAALDRAGGEAPLLSARISALAGRNVEAIRLIEAARKERPADPDVYATAAEVYAAAGKLDAGWDEVKQGQAACGEAAELSRARGVLWISRQGGGRKGLELLEAARRADPGLPFVERALSQAHLLVGKQDAAAKKPAEALVHARAAVSLDPEDVDARRFLSESLAAIGDFEGALAELERLVARGEPLGSELALTHKKAGIAALLERKRELALGHFAAARKLGLSDTELSTGARLLEEEAGARVEKGIAAYQAGDLEAAKASFRVALDLDPDRIQAKNSLAVVLFKEKDFAGAAELWRAVIGTARKEGLALPEPVHLNLAKAQVLCGDPEGARTTLEEYLAREPQGEWAAQTREALLALPAKKSGD
jgi:tetratricopeptide (TPR) repeat protein